MKFDELLKRATPLLEQAGVGDAFRVEPLAGGANNQIFLIRADKVKVCLKAYFRHPNDPRDRLKTEYAFLKFAWNGGIRCIPEPLGRDEANGFAIYEYVPGPKLAALDVTAPFIEQALAFYEALNQGRRTPEAERLDRASEFCISLSDHMNLVHRRVERLKKIDNTSAIGNEAQQFVCTTLTNAWHESLRYTESQALEYGIELGAEQNPGDLRLSPSDFGFHNAIVREGQSLVFVDFEYAGWDDPHRMVCDFFCQPAVPIQSSNFDWFAERVASELSDPEASLKCIELLLPIYQIKWCCIMLNDFLPTDGARRAFASDRTEREIRQRRQLGKARHALQRVDLQPQLP